MQNLTLVMIALIAVTVAVTAAVALLERRGRITRVQTVLGLGIGLLGAFAVLVPRVDLVPDGPEELLQQLFVVGVTGLAIVGTWVRIARA